MRVDNWEHKLSEYIEANRDKTFKYGAWDCCIFTAGIVKEITGKNYIKEFKYKSKKKAESVLQEHGGIIKILNERFENINPLKAQRGDIIFCDGAIGICIGAKAVFVNLQGYSFILMKSWQYAWRV